MSLSSVILLFAGGYRYFSEDLGFNKENITGDPAKALIIDLMSGGVVCFDYNNDGYQDIYFVNGAQRRGKVTPNQLYRNRGDGTFEEVGRQAGVADLGWGMGGTAADFDNDGDMDLYVTNYGRNRLFRNNGDGTFSDVTESSGTGCDAWSASAAFADFDRDGFLDLYVTNYVDFSFANPPTSGPFCQFRGKAVACGPRRYPAAPDVLYKNQRDGSFWDISKSAGVADKAYYGLGVVCTDYDNDADIDIYVANDSVPNNLYQNDGRGRFTDVALVSGVAVDGNGKEQAGMGVDAGDYNNDGWIDFYVTNFQDEYNTLYRNLSQGIFVDVTKQSGLMRPTMEYLGFGTGFLDFNRDGKLDLFVANGHIYDNIAPYAMPDQLFLNTGAEKFEDVSNLLVSPVPLRVSRGSAFADLDNNGTLEIIVSNLDERPTVYRLEQSRRPWIGLRLEGRRANRDAIGTRVYLRIDGQEQMREVRSASSYCSQNDIRLLFGLPDGEKTETELEIRWISGKRSLFRNLGLNRYHHLVEPRED